MKLEASTQLHIHFDVVKSVKVKQFLPATQFDDDLAQIEVTLKGTTMGQKEGSNPLLGDLVDLQNTSKVPLQDLTYNGGAQQYQMSLYTELNEEVTRFFHGQGELYTVKLIRAYPSYVTTQVKVVLYCEAEQLCEVLRGLMVEDTQVKGLAIFR